MSVNDNDVANEGTFNAGFMSRNSNTDTTGKVDLKNAGSANITDLQQTINDDEAAFTAHAADDNAHREEDTKANLIAWAATADNGAQAFATDEKLAYQAIDGSLEAIGGGGDAVGDVHQYGLINPTDYDLSTWDVTNLSNAVMSIITSGYLFSGSSYKIVNAVGAAAEYAFGPGITVDFGRTGKNNVMTPTYTYPGTTGAIRFHFWDNTNAKTLGYEDVVSTTIPTAIPVNKYVNDAVLSVTTRVEIITGEAFDLIFDNITFSDAAFFEKELYNVSDMEQYTPVTQGLGTISNDEVFWKRDGDVMEVRGRFTVGTVTASEIQIGLPNSEVVSSELVNFAVVGYGARGSDGTGDEFPLATGGDSYLNIGSKLASLNVSDGPQNGNAIFVNSTQYHFFARVPIEGWKSETAAVVHSGSGTENIFSARIANDGAASITSQSSPNSPAIASVVRTSAGLVTITLTPGFFTVAPSAIANPLDTGSSNRDAMVDSVTTSQITVRSTSPSDASAVDMDFSIHLQNQGADYKNPNAYAVTPLTETCYIKDIKSSGVQGGDFVSGDDGGIYGYERDLNYITPGIGWASLVGSKILIQPGEYEIESEAPAQEVGPHKAVLYNNTVPGITIIGTSAQVRSDNSYATTNSKISDHLSITVPTLFSIRHRCFASRTGAGRGNASSFGIDEVYTTVKITKLLWR